MFPDLEDKTSELLRYSRMKMYILNAASVYSKEEPDEDEIKDLNHDYNWFLVNENVKSFSYENPESVVNQLDKNFYLLCAVMEENGSTNPHLYTVAQFYGKISYINAQAAQEQDGG